MQIFEGVDGLLILTGIAVIRRNRSYHFGIGGSRAARSFQHVVRRLAIPGSLIGASQQKFGSRCRLYGFRASQIVESPLRIGGQKQFARQLKIHIASGIGRQNLVQRLLRVFAASHAGVGLRQTGESLHRRWPQSETAMIGIDGQGILSAQAGGVSQGKPEIRILGSGLHRALGVHRCIACVAVLERGLRGSRFARHLDARAPAHPGLVPVRRLIIVIGLRASLFRRRGRIRRSLAVHIEGLGSGRSRDQQDCKPHPSPEP